MSRVPAVSGCVHNCDRDTTPAVTSRFRAFARTERLLLFEELMTSAAAVGRQSTLRSLNLSDESIVVVSSHHSRRDVGLWPYVYSRHHKEESR
jgi:hypothetical protein